SEFTCFKWKPRRRTRPLCHPLGSLELDGTAAERLCAISFTCFRSSFPTPSQGRASTGKKFCLRGNQSLGRLASHSRLRSSSTVTSRAVCSPGASGGRRVIPKAHREAAQRDQDQERDHDIGFAREGGLRKARDDRSENNHHVNGQLQQPVGARKVRIAKHLGQDASIGGRQDRAVRALQE